MKFEWNPGKATANRKKHGVSFEEAETVFYDEFAVQFFDDAHSGQEDRFIMLGMSNQANLLIVCHCEQESEDVIRIISARRATRSEARHYVRG